MNIKMQREIATLLLSSAPIIIAGVELLCSWLEVNTEEVSRSPNDALLERLRSTPCCFAAVMLVGKATPSYGELILPWISGYEMEEKRKIEVKARSKTKNFVRRILFGSATKRRFEATSTDYK